MSERDDTVYLKHILDAIKKIKQYLKNINETSFIQNSLFQDAVIRQIEIIGEAARNISTQLIDEYPSVPWQDVIGMRHKLIHDYFGVDIEAVWKTATEDVPILEKQVRLILKNFS